MKLHDLSVAEAAAGIRARRFSALELTQALLQRAQAHAALGCYLQLAPEAAEGAARGMQSFGVRAAAETSATQREMVRRAKAAGVRIAAGTDTGCNGFGGCRINIGTSNLAAKGRRFFRNELAKAAARAGDDNRLAFDVIGHRNILS